MSAQAPAEPPATQVNWTAVVLARDIALLHDDKVTSSTGMHMRTTVGAEVGVGAWACRVGGGGEPGRLVVGCAAFTSKSRANLNAGAYLSACRSHRADGRQKDGERQHRALVSPHVPRRCAAELALVGPDGVVSEADSNS
jgi:hypothetical protein